MSRWRYTWEFDWDGEGEPDLASFVLQYNDPPATRSAPHWSTYRLATVDEPLVWNGPTLGRTSLKRRRIYRAAQPGVGE